MDCQKGKKEKKSTGTLRCLSHASNPLGFGVWQATCFPTWPKLFLFQAFYEVWHSSTQASNGHYAWPVPPLFHASSTTLLHLSSASHIDLNRNNLGCCRCCLGRLVSLSTSCDQKPSWTNGVASSMEKQLPIL